MIIKALKQFHERNQVRAEKRENKGRASEREFMVLLFRRFVEDQLHAFVSGGIFIAVMWSCMSCYCCCCRCVFFSIPQGDGKAIWCDEKWLLFSCVYMNGNRVFKNLSHATAAQREKGGGRETSNGIRLLFTLNYIFFSFPLRMHSQG
jgi:hypothetical protein